MEKVLFLSITGFLIISGIIIFFSGSISGNLFVSTDKDSYDSGEIMEIELLYNSVKDMDNIRIAISGIKNRYGGYILNVVDLKNFSSGENRQEYSLKLPSCSSCSGISPGEYNLVVTMEKDDMIIANKSVFFELG